MSRTCVGDIENATSPEKLLCEVFCHNPLMFLHLQECIEERFSVWSVAEISFVHAFVNLEMETKGS